MRIIAGLKRGMKLLPPKGNATRPIIDRVKESLFSVLYKYDVIEDGMVADIFCGTGSLGLEALSRGARHVTFVEKDTKTADILRRNIEKAQFVAESKVIRANAFKVGACVVPGDEKCRLVFVDPPYAMAQDTDESSRLGGLLMLLDDQLAGGAIVVVRAHKDSHLMGEYGRLSVIDRRQWGRMAVTILQFAEQVQNDDE